MADKRKIIAMLHGEKGSQARSTEEFTIYKSDKDPTREYVILIVGAMVSKEGDIYPEGSCALWGDKDFFDSCVKVGVNIMVDASEVK